MNLDSSVDVDESIHHTHGDYARVQSHAVDEMDLTLTGQQETITECEDCDGKDEATTSAESASINKLQPFTRLQNDTDTNELGDIKANWPRGQNGYDIHEDSISVPQVDLEFSTKRDEVVTFEPRSSTFDGVDDVQVETEFGAPSWNRTGGNHTSHHDIPVITTQPHNDGCCGDIDCCEVSF